MEHNEIRHKLSEYIDGSITAEERTAIDEHLKICSACSDALRELRKTIEHIRTVEEVEPPAWMTQKIMAEVRSAEAGRKSFLRKLFFPLSVKIPVQAVAVLFLAVGALYIYRSIQPAYVPSEAPVKEFEAKREAPPVPAKSREEKTTRGASQFAKRVPQSPEYKALDMKQEYEKPAPPVPESPAAAPGLSPAKRAEQSVPAKKEFFSGENAAAPQAGAAALMQKQAETTRAAAASRVSKQKAVAKAESDMTTVKSGSRQGESAGQTESDVENMKALDKYFASRSLAENRALKELKFSTSRIQENLQNIQWVDDATRKALQSCRQKYRIDALLVEKRQVYLYCLDNSIIKSLGKYEQQSGKWMRLK